MEPVMMEKHPRARIHIGKRIFGFTMLHEHTRSDFAVAFYELEDGIGGNFGTGGGELHEGFETGVGFAENGVAVAGDYAAGFEGGPEVGFYGGVGEGSADMGLHLENPAEDFLGGEAIRLLAKAWRDFGGQGRIPV